MSVFKALTLIFVSFGVANAAQVCKARLDCPGNYNNDTVRVAQNVVALSENFFHCAPDSFNEGFSLTGADTISLFFIIDHSGSMSVMDSTGIRYKLFNSIVDSLRAKSPASEVGVAVFSNQLLHNHEDDPFFEQLDPRWHDSYAPLTRLNETVGGVSAVEKLKWALQISSTPNDTDMGRNQRLLNGNYSPTGRLNAWGIDGGYNGTTDISLAFEAARKAFLSASYPKENQYIIFLSDGESQNVDQERKNFESDYIQGENLPTTFTAYFINVNRPIPSQINTMTDNIAANGYSNTNQSSEVWKTSGSQSDLASKLIGQLALGGGSKYFTSTPLSLTVNGITTSKFDDSLAYLPRVIPLSGQSTTLNVSYKWHWNPPLDRDETATYTTVIIQSQNPDNLNVGCWDQGYLKFYYQNTDITGQIIQVQQTSIEVRYYPPADPGITGADIVVKNAEGTDSLVLRMVDEGQYYSAIFTREYGSPESDNLLQNAFSDSVIAIYRNPAVPLDTIRIASKVAEPRDIGVRNAFYVDSNGDGYPDIIRVIQGTEVLSKEDLSVVKGYINLQTERPVSVKAVDTTALGFDIFLNVDKTLGAPFTGLFPDERLVIDRVADLPDAGEFPFTSILLSDSMAPVILEATYYDNASTSVRDTLNVMFSEEIDSIANLYPFLFRAAADIEDYKPRLSTVRVDSNSAVFSVIPVSGIQDVKKGDSIHINPLADVSDVKGNVQTNPDNVRRNLDYFLLYSIKTAAYYDTTGDGLIDMIKVTMDKTPDSLLLRQLYSTVELPSYRNFSYKLQNFTATEYGFTIGVKQPAGTEPNTAVDSRDVLEVRYTEAANGSVVMPDKIPIADSLSPVLISAKYVPGETKGSVRTDSLIAEFAESVPVPSSDQPFTFYDPVKGVTYTMELRHVKQNAPDEHVFAVISIEGREFPDMTDSVSINPDADLKDAIGNIQDSPNRRSQLLFGEQDNKYRIISFPNPFDPISSTIPASVRSYYGIKEKNGLVVISEPILKLAGHITLSGSMVIYDAVGNVVTKNVIGNVQQSSKGVAFVWDGRNKKGRLVGAGTYLAMIVIKDSQGKVYPPQKFKIGVRRTVISEKIR
ncbi:MAG: hypothetical protein GX556_19155 [Fibrobacter sp.]|nr:hypothetical protein [Fibrobacter sp.]